MNTARFRCPLPTCKPSLVRNFLGNHYVYCVLSQRAGGLSIGINMNPDQACNFDCVYCEVDRRVPKAKEAINGDMLSRELEKMLLMAHASSEEAPLCGLPFREVALSGDGEPTLSPDFASVVETVVHLRARSLVPFFKIVLITNTTGLGLPHVRAGIALLTNQDEIWAKLDAGTQKYMDVVNRPSIPLDEVIRNIRRLGRQRPIVIQSLFPMIGSVEPSAAEIMAYARRLRTLKEAGTQISLVQIYSAHRPAVNEACSHLPLKSLSQIARTVRQITGLNVEVF